MSAASKRVKLKDLRRAERLGKLLRHEKHQSKNPAPLLLMKNDPMGCNDKRTSPMKFKTYNKGIAENKLLLNEGSSITCKKYDRKGRTVNYCHLVGRKKNGKG